MNVLKELSQIINKESKTTTYKFALIRGVIESIHRFDHYCVKKDGKVILPLGLMTLLWIKYYYPILSNKIHIPQITGKNTKLVFRDELQDVIDYYQSSLGYSILIKDLHKGKVSDDVSEKIIKLIQKVSTTIVKNPMQYMGSTINRQGEIFKYIGGKKFGNLKKELSVSSIIEHGGTYAIDADYYEAYKLLGAFINGENAIIFQWIDFSYRQMHDSKVEKSELFSVINTYEDSLRDTTKATAFFNEKLGDGQMTCVWSGKKINKDLNIDHVIPYSLWQNNDLWNLLPSKSSVNGRKSDKVPHVKLLEERKPEIIAYWQLIHKHKAQVFRNEISHALCGNILEEEDFYEQCFEGLKAKCDFLVEHQGYDCFLG